ncbi:MOSC N-terminal beta barrel domain-containing protein [Trebonia sp.]|uniref:MOSC domain-containing protein n=1 Tax=Trebonia sp. TaxID=2767075 RepID=UPI0026176797|nr:MOSC N-terminal beta barrel domain-containing protein [Trebonia sp.]
MIVAWVSEVPTGTPGDLWKARMGTLASVHIYPLKGCRAVDLGAAAVEPWGLAGDRRWLLVDADYRFISQREHALMARVVVTYGPGAGIAVAADGHPPLWVPAPAGEQAPDPELLKVTVWGSTLLAAAAGAEADAWFSAYLGEPARLVYLDDPTRRAVDPEFGADGDVVSFADGYPLLLTNTGSLRQLGEWLAAAGEQPVPMNRFRPNVVVTGFEPWAEDRWRRVRIGPVSFRVAKPCGRCVVTTTDQVTGARGTQPLKILGRKRRFGQSLVFGQNIIPDSPGVIRVGDPVEITEYAPYPDAIPSAT